MNSSTVFSFKLTSAPIPYTPVRYDQIGDKYYVTVSYDRKSFFGDYPIHQIIIYHSLNEGIIVPTAPGRSLITSQSLQIPFGEYTIKCAPGMKLDEEATLTVRDLIPSEEDATCLRSGTITLTVGTKTYTITPTTFSDNRITKATCSQSGGRRKRRTITRRKAIKKKTRRSF
jgi:hypothetical protein